MVPVTSL